jgi:hypothetical protein
MVDADDEELLLHHLAEAAAVFARRH